MPDIYLDLDIHAIYPQAMRAARRYALEVYVISRDYMPADENVHLIAVEDDQMNGGAWIVANILCGDICVTADSGVAAKCIARGALALSPAGRQWGANTGSADVQRFGEQRPADARALAQRLDKAILSARALSGRDRTSVV